MSDAACAIWITRPLDGARRTRTALHKAGLKVIVAPVLEVGPVAPEPMPAPPWPTWLVFVSATAIEGFLKARALPGFPDGHGLPRTRVAVVGQRTAEAA